MQDQKPGSVARRRDAQAPARFVEVRLDGLRADAEDARHLLGLVVLGDQAQDLLLPFAQHCRSGRPVVQDLLLSQPIADAFQCQISAIFAIVIAYDEVRLLIAATSLDFWGLFLEELERARRFERPTLTLAR